MKKYRIYIEERVEHNHLVEFETDLIEEKIEEVLNNLEGDVSSLGEVISDLSKFKITKISFDKGTTMEISIPNLDKIKQ